MYVRTYVLRSKFGFHWENTNGRALHWVRWTDTRGRGSALARLVLHRGAVRVDAALVTDSFACSAPLRCMVVMQLLMFNSLKMKMSVIIGVLQMGFGVVLRAMNAVYFKESLDFFFEFLPMIVFLCSLFM